MLIDIDTGKTIDRIPHPDKFQTLRGRLTEAEFAAMVERIDELIDESGAEIATAGCQAATGPGPSSRPSLRRTVARTSIDQ